MRPHLAELAHATFGLPTLEEQPPRPDGPCRLCGRTAWVEGSGTWFCGVCHPLDPKPGQCWKQRFPKINAWEGVLQAWIESNRRNHDPLFKSSLEETSSSNMGKE